MSVTVASRIHLLSAELADQIAAGEVVERPASVVRELVDNAIDAGATRVDVALERAGVEAIRVVDDGRGIAAEDLSLALQRHATSKLRSVHDLVDVATLGFRGEALASIAAVAHVRLRSRVAEANVGRELRTRPGESGEATQCGMPTGTQVEVRHLFANIPARRKFLRSAATEVGQCCDVVLRQALLHPEVHFSLCHDGRTLLELQATDGESRIERVLTRRAAADCFHAQAEVDGVHVELHWLDPALAHQARGGLYVCVRRRVVQERALTSIVQQAASALLPVGRQLIGCLIVEPPAGSVDVNVHPQKAEVRFSAAQSIYGVVREFVGRVLFDPERRATHAAESANFAVSGVNLAGDAAAARAREALGRGLQNLGSQERTDNRATALPYRLSTRALDSNYARYKHDARDDVERLRSVQMQVRTLGERIEPDEQTSLAEVAVVDDAVAAPTWRSPAEIPVQDPPVDARISAPELLTCLPEAVALFREGDDVLVVDLGRVRAHLLERRLAHELSHGSVGAQVLLHPVVVKLDPADVSACLEASDALATLGVHLDAFGDDAVIVRALPTILGSGVEEPEVDDLLRRLCSWLRLRRTADREPGPAHASGVRVLAQTRGRDPVPRFARRWLRELVEEGATLDAVPGVRRFTAIELLELLDRQDP